MPCVEAALVNCLHTENEGLGHTHICAHISSCVFHCLFGGHQIGQKMYSFVFQLKWLESFKIQQRFSLKSHATRFLEQSLEIAEESKKCSVSFSYSEIQDPWVALQDHRCNSYSFPQEEALSRMWDFNDAPFV